MFRRQLLPHRIPLVLSKRNCLFTEIELTLFFLNVPSQLNMFSRKLFDNICFPLNRKTPSSSLWPNHTGMYQFHAFHVLLK